MARLTVVKGHIAVGLWGQNLGRFFCCLKKRFRGFYVIWDILEIFAIVRACVRACVRAHTLDQVLYVEIFS